MTLALNIPVQTEAKKKESALKVTVPLDGGRPSYAFEPNDHIIDRQSPLTIELKPMTDDVNHDQNAKIEIFSYCTTELDPNKVRVTATRSKGIPTNIAPDSTSQEAAFPKETDAVDLLINLRKRQLTFIGIIIKVARAGKDDMYYLCDPQVGNGPTGTGGLVEAAKLTL